MTSHVQSIVTTVVVQWPSIFELILALWFSEQMYTVSVRLRLLSLECSSCSDADPGTSASTRCVQHRSQRHWTTPFPTSQHARSASLECFGPLENECASMGWLCRRESWRTEIVLLIFSIAFYSKRRCAFSNLSVALCIQHSVENASFQQVPRLSSKCAPELSERLLSLSRRSHAAVDGSFSSTLFFVPSPSCSPHFACSAIT